MIARVLGRLFQPLVALIGLALFLAAALALIPLAWTWYAGGLPKGIPAAVVGAFGVAIVVGFLTSPRSPR